MQNKLKTNAMPRLMFILGAAVDGGIALSWFMIASGWKIPNILNGHTGTGQDYQLAMYVAAMFMAGWTVLLAWGALEPIERRELLLITSALLLLSVILEALDLGCVICMGLFRFFKKARCLASPCNLYYR